MTLEVTKLAPDQEIDTNEEILLRKKIVMKLIYDQGLTDQDQINRMVRLRLRQEKEKRANHQEDIFPQK